MSSLDMVGSISGEQLQIALHAITKVTVSAVGTVFDSDKTFACVSQ